MTGSHQVYGDGGGIGHDADGLSAVCGADAGGDAAVGIHADLEIGLKSLPILANHAFDAQLMQTFRGGGDANQAATVLGHKIDRRRRYELAGHNQVTFVFAVGIVYHNHHAPFGDIGDHGIDGIEPLCHINPPRLPEGRAISSRNASPEFPPEDPRRVARSAAA